MTDVLASLAHALTAGDITVVDLTQTLSEDTPLLVLPEPFGQTAAFSREEISRYDERGVAWHWNNFTVGEHTGTHFDAPVHWVSGKDLPDNTIDKVPPQKLVAPAVVLDFSAECAANPDFLLTAEHIKVWEAEHGAIPAGAWVLFRTDWSKLDVDAYTNRKEDGAHTPGPDASAIQYILDRDALGFGVETIGTDAGQAHLLEPMYPAHTLLHGAGKYGLQCLENLDRLPATGAIVIASPLKILGGSGSPLRVLALVSE
ncbi:cyclase family protein [Novosphingobium resinovorum]|uniref:Cyclase n=1 Tax=Novosphingobium resinovorum TaxID=158500 RepID=A0A031K1H2_9SPHN|nr:MULTISPECIES: cyclase family protein [Novosphingobium]AOR78955.1 cyclase [Novosphingobium resinovorum]EZP82858.1 Cyclase family protein [Novosphingobium resinovorum]MBF7014497.1 cyclase family protein [Novosphingobium sp. HR1a]WJM25022.1 cyclase family protein [Novosphingobium resinovorum]